MTVTAVRGVKRMTGPGVVDGRFGGKKGDRVVDPAGVLTYFELEPSDSRWKERNKKTWPSRYCLLHGEQEQ